MDAEITIKKAVLHILDNSIEMPVLSDTELAPDEETDDFLGRHLVKIFESHNLKNAWFIGNDNPVRRLCEHLGAHTEDFLPVCRELAGILFTIMIKNVDIAPADLICCLFSCGSRPYLGILKLNYRLGYTHYVRQEESGCSNTVIRHRTLLPSESQKIDECVLIDLEEYAVKLMEKEYEINGQKDFYLSSLFLRCSSDLSSNAKLKILDKVTQQINKKYYDEDFEKVAKLKKAVSESLEETSTIRVDMLAEEVFENNLEVRNEYLEEIQKAGLTERSIPVPESLAAKKFRTHKIKTDTGIEINFPLELYEDKDKIEFINNPDGTISILIKNVGRISNR